MVPFGAPFWAPKSSQNETKFKLESSSAFSSHFWPCGGLRGCFLGRFWSHFGVLFWCPRREAGICGKPCFLQTVQHFLRFFQVPGGRKSTKHNVMSGNRIQLKPGCKSVLGGSWERFWSHLGAILGPKIGPEEGPKTSWIFGLVLRILACACWAEA